MKYILPKWFFLNSVKVIDDLICSACLKVSANWMPLNNPQMYRQSLLSTSIQPTWHHCQDWLTLALVMYMFKFDRALTEGRYSEAKRDKPSNSWCDPDSNPLISFTRLPADRMRSSKASWAIEDQLESFIAHLRGELVFILVDAITGISPQTLMIVFVLW